MPDGNVSSETDLGLAASRLMVLALSLTAVVVVPAYFAAVVPRTVFFRLLVTWAAAFAVYAAWAGRTGALPLRDPVAWSLLAFTVVSAISAVAGSSPLHSLFGDVERMWGVVAWAYLLAFYLIGRSTLDELWWRRLLGAILVVAVIVALHRLGRGYLPDVIPVLPGSQARGAGFAGSPAGFLGNQGYLAAYLFASLAVAIALLRRARSSVGGWAVSVAGAIVLWAFLVSMNRAVAGALVVGTGAAGVTYSLTTNRRRLRWLGLGLVALVVCLVTAVGVSESARGIVAAFVPRVRQLFSEGMSLSLLGDRLVAWQAGIESVKDNPLLGVGPENFGVAFDRNFDPAWWNITGEMPWDRAHNVFLEPFVASGVLGGLAYLAIWLAAIWALWRGYRSGRLTPSEYAIFLGGTVGFAAYLFFWFEDISSFFVLLAFLGYGVHRSMGRPSGGSEPVLPGTGSRPALAFALATVAMLVSMFHIEYYWAARATHRGGEAETLEQVVPHYEQAVNYRLPGEEEIPAEFARVVGGLADQIREMPRNRRPQQLLERTVESSREAIDRAVRWNPEKGRLRLSYAGVLMTSYLVTAESRYLEEAIQQAEHALRTRPNRITYYHRLADLYLIAGDYRSAAAAAEEARSRYGKLPETYYYLSRAFHGLEQQKAAYAALFHALRRGYRLSDLSYAQDVLEATPDQGRAARRDSLCAYLPDSEEALCGQESSQ